MAKSKKRIIRMSVLPGEPLNGGGRVCIHLFVQDKDGMIVEPHVLHPVFDENGNLVKQKLCAKPTRGYLACDPKRKVAPVVRNGVTIITVRTDDPRAVTCPKCIESTAYKQALIPKQQARGEQ